MSTASNQSSTASADPKKSMFSKFTSKIAKYDALFILLLTLAFSISYIINAYTLVLTCDTIPSDSEKSIRKVALGISWTATVMLLVYIGLVISGKCGGLVKDNLQKLTLYSIFIITLLVLISVMCIINQVYMTMLNVKDYTNLAKEECMDNGIYIFCGLVFIILLMIYLGSQTGTAINN